jgi:hypothetical protein
MGQLDVTDQEACFERGRHNASEVANFLRNAADYLSQNGPVIAEGDTMDSSDGTRWQSKTFPEGICQPPRRVRRWLPMDGSTLPSGVL